MLKAQICFSVILILYMFSENTLKLFYRWLRLHMEIMLILHWFNFNEVVSKNTKSILAYTENMLKEYKLIRKIRQEYFAKCREYIDQHKTEEFLIQTKKISDPKSPF